MKSLKQLARIALALTVSGVSSAVVAADWRDHAPPRDFLFGNHIDSHQQMTMNRNGDLRGFLYIAYTGELVDGVPVARHCDANTPPQSCVTGWKLKGKPVYAQFLYHHHDHPVWLVEDRTEVPQPGAYGHFHWVTPMNGGNDPRASASDYDPLCLAQTAEELMGTPICPGYLLELQALRRFVFEHGGERIPVRPGLDIATHVNIVTSAHGMGGDHGH